MSTDPSNSRNQNWPTLAQFPVPVKALISFVILTITVAMLGALGQILIHDILPAFFTESSPKDSVGMSMESMPDDGSAADQTSGSERGDLFSDEVPAAQETATSMPFYKTEQFVWTLKWTHIHLFGMNMIFIFMGIIAIFLNQGNGWKTLLVVLPFVGVLIDIAAIWLKGYVSPAFFWLHIPGGGLFVCCFLYVSARAFGEMWWMRNHHLSTSVE